MKPSEKELLIARNEFCKNAGSEFLFKKYFNLLLKQEKKEPNPSVKYDIIQQADTALSVFCERVELNDEIIQHIDKYHSDIDNCFQELNEMSAGISDADDSNDSQIARNEINIQSLAKLKEQMSNITSQSLFDKCLDRLSEIDENIDKESLTREQKKEYDRLTNEFSKVVSDKVNLLNFRKEKDYNASALKEIHTVYYAYKNDEKKYNDFNDETKALIKRLFCFNSSRLTSEVLIYYNQVYSFIFSKLNDEEKFELTEMSLQRFDIE